MADNMIKLIAQLDVDKSAQRINREDIPKLAKELSSIEIKCVLSDSSKNKLQEELNKISKQMKFNISTDTFKIDTSGSKSASGIMDKIATGADKAEESVKKVSKSIADLDSDLLSKLQGFEPKFIDNPEGDNDGVINIEATKQALAELLKPLGEVSVVAKAIAGDAPDSLHRLEASIVSSRGEVKKLNLELRDSEELFDLVSSTYSDKGVATQTAKLQKNINSITQEYDKLKGSVGNFNTDIFAEIEKDGEKTIVTFDTLEKHIQGLADGTVGIEQVENEITAMKGSIHELDALLGQSQGKGFNRFQNAEITAREFDNTLKQIDIDIKALDSNNDEVKGLASSFKEVSDKIKQLQEADTRDNAWLEKFSKVNIEIRDLQKNIATVGKSLKQQFKSDNNLDTLKNRINKVSAALTDWGNKNKKAITSNKQMSDGVKTYADRWAELNSRISALATKVNSQKFLDESDVATLKHLNEEIATYKKEADAANLTTNSLFRNMRTQLSQVLMQWISLQGAVRIVRSMVSEVTDLDSAMINLRKVTDETNSTYKSFISSAQKQAAQLHATTTDVVEQSAEWAKLGFNLKEAQELSRTSMIYSKVGEVNNETAVSDLVTVLKAYGQTAEESIRTVDALNDLGNKFATDAKSLGEGLSVSASALAMAGNDLNQSLALITGGSEITQNARETGNAIKVISLRIRGMKGALEELNEETDGIESISKIQTQILNLTKNKVNIFNDDGSFRTTYDILKDVSEIYDSLSDPEKASITEILFGKVRANQGLALIQAFQSGRIEEAYNTAVNSAGSAQREFDKMSEGIQAHLQDLKQAFEQLANTILDSKLVNTVIDSGTTILKGLTLITDKLGTLPTLITGLATYGSLKHGVGRPFKPNMPKLVLLQINVRSDTPQTKRAFQLLELRVANTQPKAV